MKKRCHPSDTSFKMTEQEYLNSIGDLDELDEQLDDLESELGDRELKHYASEYYDPAKAHEYYMRNRELKGRNSTAKLNEDGRSAAKYVKEQLNTERKGKVETHSDQTKSNIESLREQKKSNIENHKTQMQGKIDSLKAKLKTMSSSQKKAKSEAIYQEIDSLREENAAERERLQEDFRQSSSNLRSDHKVERERLKEEYDQKYTDELDKIRATKSFQKVSKRKR